MPIFRSDQGFVRLQVDGVVLDLKSWDKGSGADIAPEMTAPYNPGGMAPSVATGGIRKRSDLTIERAWDDILIAAYLALENASGIASIIYSYTPYRPNRKTPASSPFQATGILGPVTRPGYDSNSGTVATLVCVCSMNE